MAFFRRFKNQKKKKRYENPAVNQAIEEIDKRKDKNIAEADSAKHPVGIADAHANEQQQSEFSPVLSFDPSGLNVENMVFKPSDAKPKISRSDQFAQEMDDIADIFGAPKPSDSDNMPYGFGDSSAPIITSMASVAQPEDAAVQRRRVIGGESLAFMDLSDRTDLQPEEIEDATEIFGIKYPAGFRVDLVNFDGREIDLSDFSLVENLRWKHIEKAADISGIVFPSTIDTDSLNFYNRNISGCDFSVVYGLRWRHIQDASDIAAIKYPATFDIDNAVFAARNISGSDFSLVASLNWEHIMSASDIRGIKYPASFDTSVAKFYGRDISGSDFSLCKNLKWADIQLASDISGIIYPETFDFSVCDFRGRDISGSDFSKAKKLTWEMLSEADDITDIKYPECFDANQSEFDGKDISGSNFSRVQTLKFAHVTVAKEIRKIVYPPQFDIDDANFIDRDVDYSDFSLLPGFNWDSIRLAYSRDNVIYPAGFVEPVPSAEDVEGAMLIYLLRLHSRVSKDNLDTDNFYKDITALYPGVNDSDAAVLIEKATRKWERENGTRIIRQEARNAHTGDKLFMTKLGFKLLYPICGGEQSAQILREAFGDIFRRSEQEKFEQRLYDLQCGKYLSAAELSEIDFKPVKIPKKAELRIVVDKPKRVFPVPFTAAEEMEAEYNASRVKAVPVTEAFGDEASQEESPLVAVADRIKVRVSESEAPILPAVEETEESEIESAVMDNHAASDNSDEAENEIQTDSAAEEIELHEAVVDDSYIAVGEPEFSEEGHENFEPVHISEASEPEEEPEQPKVYTFGSMPAQIDIDMTPPEIPDEVQPEPEYIPISQTVDSPKQVKQSVAPIDEPDEPSPIAQSIGVNENTFTPVQIQMDKLRDSAVNEPEEKLRRKKLSDEEKAIRTGIMGMLLYIHQSVSESDLTNSELFGEFMKIYPGALPKETAAMAQFAANTLSGTNSNTRAKLFMFATKADVQVKRKLLDFALDRFTYKLRVPEDESVFREFLLTLCMTLFEDSGDYEYASYLTSKGILKNPPTERDAHYRRIPFERGVGKANLYANTHYPYYRTLEQVGFSHFTFEAIRDSLKIELSDSHYYEELEDLVYKKCEPGLMKFIVIETTMGLLYLEQRTLSDWGVDEEFVWRAAENNMKNITFHARYSFGTEDCSSFRYIQHDLASYVLCMPDYLKELSDGKDLIFTSPCREIVYIDFYDFAAIKEMLGFCAHYDCTLHINGDEYEHPFAPDVFIYHADDSSLERVNDETYILLGDSVARRQVLKAVLPQEIKVDIEAIVKPRTTDEVEIIGDENYNLQAAAFTILRLYSEMNGDRDYTLPQNAVMAVFDDLFISFDAVYPPVRGREQPDPLQHIDDSARMVARGGKTVSWLLVQAIQYLCGDVNYETPASTNIRQTVLREIYGDSANAVWLNCATATEFRRRFEATRRYHEIQVENQHLTILDAKVEVAMHAFVMIFHQFGQRYALGEVRRHLYKIMPDIKFCYEINQSAWLPAPGDDIDVDVQSIGMIFRGFDNATQENILTGLANAIGDRDLAEGGWGLLYFIKFVKYAYLDPSEMVERYFISRSRLIPSQNILKQLYYKDLNNEFIKHMRKSVRQMLADYGDSFELIRNSPVRSANSAESDVQAEDFENVLNFAREIEEKMNGKVEPSAAESDMINIYGGRPMATPKPDLQLRQVENGFLEKRLNFVLEPVDARMADQLVDAAHFVTKLFHVPEIEFRANNDLECELHYGIIRSRNHVIALRSLAWTTAQLMYESGRDLRDVTDQDVYHANEIVEQCDRNNYKKTGAFPTLCSMPVDEGMYIPAYQEYIFFAQELMPEVKLASLFSLQQELADIAPMMKVVYDILKSEKRDGPVQSGTVLADALCAWSAYCFASVDAFEVVAGPAAYSFGQIKR